MSGHLQPDEGTLQLDGEPLQHLTPRAAFERGIVVVGKSTLINRLARREVAIVTDIPGTTRDAMEVALDLGGVPVVLVDTAGVRETRDPIEAEGVRRALARAEFGGPCPVAGGSKRFGSLSAFGGTENNHRSDQERSHQFGYATAINERRQLAGLRKNQFGHGSIAELAHRQGAVTRRWRTGARNARAPTPCAEGVPRSIGSGDGGCGPGQEELVAEEFQLAARALGRVTGRVDVEDVLDQVFRNFCIGK